MSIIATADGRPVDQRWLDAAANLAETEELRMSVMSIPDEPIASYYGGSAEGIALWEGFSGHAGIGLTSLETIVGNAISDLRQQVAVIPLSSTDDQGG